MSVGRATRRTDPARPTGDRPGTDRSDTTDPAPTGPARPTRHRPGDPLVDRPGDRLVDPLGDRPAREVADTLVNRFTKTVPSEVAVRRSPPATPALVAAAVLAVVGCGAEEEPRTQPSPAVFTDGTARFVGTGAVSWETDRVVAEVVDGELEMTVVCEGPTPHDIAIEGVQDGESLVGCEGQDQATATVAVPADATLDFWCTIPGHRSAGMEGVLTTTGAEVS